MAFRNLIILLVIIALSISCNREHLWQNALPTPFMQADPTAVDLLLNQLTLSEKISQLILLKSDDAAECLEDSLYSVAKAGKIGGLILKNQTLNDYIRIINNCQDLSPQPLWIGTEENVSLCNQFQDAVPFPTATSIAAISNDSIQQQILDLYLRQAEAMGIHFSLASTINQNTSKSNTYDYINYQNDPQAILNRASKMVRSLQSKGILAVGNSFSDLVYMPNDTLGILDSILHIPNQLTQQGLSAWKLNNSIFESDSIQHYFPAYAKDYLYHELGFGGLVMSEVSEAASVEKLLHAGNDVFIVTENLDAVFQALYTYASTGILSEKSLNAKVRKVLLAKQWAFAKSPPQQKIMLDKAKEVIQNEHFEFFVQQLHQQAVILAHNENALPFNYTYNRDFQLFYQQDTEFKSMHWYMQKYAKVRAIPIDWEHTETLDKNALAARLFFSKKQINKGLDELKKKGGTKILVLDQTLFPKQDAALINAVNQLTSEHKIIVVNYGNPYNLKHFNQRVTSIQVFEKNKTTQQYVAELLFGGRTAVGQLPLAIAEHLPYHATNKTPITRINFASPKELGIAPEKLVGIDAIVNSAIRHKAIPGAQVLVIRKGSVIYNKSFGYHTYTKQQAVRNSDMYDLASLTKITATTLATMKLYEQTNFNLSDPLSNYFDVKPKSRFGRITLNKLLLHTSRLQANMPVYGFIKNSSVQQNTCNDNFCGQARPNFNLKIADNVFMRDALKDDLFDKVLKLKPYKSSRYRYSDVNFNLIQKIIESKTKQSLDNYLNATFYRSLNMNRCLYNPRKRFKASDLVPTANDYRWRKQVLQGFVHDESAALLGGVAGNAGLFSNAEDLGVLYQMLLNGGIYGNQRYLKPQTIELFTSKQKGSRRGLGFDKPRKTKYPSYSSKTSKQAYGHTGFTGTAVWVDPKEELVFVFLSNRIHPKPDNTRLFREKTRRRVHDVIFKAFDTYEVNLPIK